VKLCGPTSSGLAEWEKGKWERGKVKRAGLVTGCTHERRRGNGVGRGRGIGTRPAAGRGGKGWLGGSCVGNRKRRKGEKSLRKSKKRKEEKKLKFFQLDRNYWRKVKRFF
jgi:hypothetical protein